MTLSSFLSFPSPSFSPHNDCNSHKRVLTEEHIWHHPLACHWFWLTSSSGGSVESWRTTHAAEPHPLFQQPAASEQAKTGILHEENQNSSWQTTHQTYLDVYHPRMPQFCPTAFSSDAKINFSAHLRETLQLMKNLLAE